MDAERLTLIAVLLLCVVWPAALIVLAWFNGWRRR